MIKELIVVEGKSDTVAVKRAVEADTIETGGSAVDRTVIAKIALAMERRGVIILTDPDHAGERIRKIVSAKVPGCKHAFIPGEGRNPQGRYWCGERFSRGDSSCAAECTYLF